MAVNATHTVVVQVVAVHVHCHRCLDTARIQHNDPDGFTRHVLQPLGSWWVSHRDPEIVRLELTTNGVPQEWVASGNRQHPTDERPSQP